MLVCYLYYVEHFFYTKTTAHNHTKYNYIFMSASLICDDITDGVLWIFRYGFPVFPDLWSLIPVSASRSLQISAIPAFLFWIRTYFCPVLTSFPVSGCLFRPGLLFTLSIIQNTYHFRRTADRWAHPVTPFPGTDDPAPRYSSVSAYDICAGIRTLRLISFI